MSVEKWWNEICGRENGRTPLNPNVVTETRIRDPSGGRRALNRLRHEAAFNYLILVVNINNIGFIYLLVCLFIHSFTYLFT